MHDPVLLADDDARIDLRDDAPPVVTAKTAPPAPAPAEVPVGDTWRWALASLVAAAGVVHLVMAPDHATESTAEGIAFLACGWLQLLAAAALVRRAPARLLAAVAVLSGAALGAWVLSRTAGLPFGPSPWTAEEAGLVDGLTAGLEGAALLLAVSLAVRPPLRTDGVVGRELGRLALPLLVVGATSAALMSPGAAEHAHGAAHEELDALGFSELTNGHHHDIVLTPLTAAEQTELDRQLVLTRQVAEQYPTVADAEAAGYKRAGPYSPGLGAHYTRPNAEALNADGIMTDAELLSPMAILYDGTEPTSQVVGFMYYSMAEDTPEGFPGQNDFWHYHDNVCITVGADGGIDAPLGADRQATQAECDLFGGTLLAQTQWMVHLWSVPGYELDDEFGGLFGEVHPALTCPDGSYFVRPVEEWPEHRLNVCRSAV